MVSKFRVPEGPSINSNLPCSQKYGDDSAHKGVVGDPLMGQIRARELANRYQAWNFPRVGRAYEQFPVEFNVLKEPRPLDPAVFLVG